MVQRPAQDPAARPAFADERHQEILAMLRDERRVDSASLSTHFGISGESIRKDLMLLEDKGLLKRVHGGAIPTESSTFEPAVSARTEFAVEKDRIAKAALEYLPTRGSILLDAGSTLERFAKIIPADEELQVFTNTLPIALSLITKPALTVHTLGGRLRQNTLAEVDDWALRSLNEINVDVAFLGTNGIDVKRGFTTPDVPEAQIKRAMLNSARQKVLLSDHSKVGLVSTIQHAQLSDVDLLITDKGISSSDLAALRAAGLEVVCV